MDDLPEENDILIIYPKIDRISVDELEYLKRIECQYGPIPQQMDVSGSVVMGTMKASCSMSGLYSFVKMKEPMEGVTEASDKLVWRGRSLWSPSRRGTLVR